ncbi:MAG: outer membrane protein [Sulfitobacter sp.]|jgi:outer membrane protein
MKQLLKIVPLAFSSLLYSSLSLSATADAEPIKDSVGPGDSDSRWIVGATAYSIKSIYSGEGDITGVAPNLEYNGEKFFVKNGSLNFNIGQYEQFTYGVTGRFASSLLADEEEYESNPLLAGINERNGSFEGGIYLNHTTDLGRFNLSVLNDFEGKHDGQTATAQYTFDFKAGQWYINPTVGLSWSSGKKLDHLYGVSGLETTATRAAYKPSSDVNLFAGVRARYEITDKWNFTAETGLTKLGSEIEDSPLIDEDLSYHGAFSLLYNF